MIGKKHLPTLKQLYYGEKKSQLLQIVKHKRNLFGAKEHVDLTSRVL